jgi:hypothetical protein
MELENSLQRSQGPTIISNYESQMNSVYIILLSFIMNRFNIILLSMSSSSSLSHSFIFVRIKKYINFSLLLFIPHALSTLASLM